MTRLFLLFFRNGLAAIQEHRGGLLEAGDFRRGLAAHSVFGFRGANCLTGAKLSLAVYLLLRDAVAGHFRVRLLLVGVECRDHILPGGGLELFHLDAALFFQVGQDRIEDGPDFQPEPALPIVGGPLSAN
ncbi:MAG: hypothetical protein ACREQ5_17030, partial [Candidatus Dormibacteria bacterium]